VYIPIVKKNTASTLTVVADIRRALPVFANSLPESVKVSYEFDESPTVVEAIRSVATEGLIGATLTGLMILLFLHDWQSVIVVVVNIPTALLGSLVGLWLTGNTINVMTLGGLALAIGVLVDEATVEIENIHSQMLHSPTISHAVRRGNAQTAVPRLLAMLCILSVFIPAFLMSEPLRSLFVPLSLAVGFAMITSYVLSSTLVPVLSVWLLGHHYKTGKRASTSDSQTHEIHSGLFGRFQAAFDKAVRWIVARRLAMAAGYVTASLAVLGLAGWQLGSELFPQVDSGQFVLRFRAPPGTNYEITRQIWNQCLQVISDEVDANNVMISMGFAGQQAPNYGMNNMLLFMRGPDDGQIRVALREGSGVHLDALREKLRKALPQRLVPWLAALLEREGLSAEQALARARLLTFGFEPGDIVSQVMSFGSLTPIEIVVASPDLKDSERYATHLREELEKVSSLRDVQIQQTLDYPSVPITIDRQKAGLSGMTTRQIGDSMLVTTSSSRMVARNYWQDPHTGVSYQVQVQVPIQRMDSAAQVETVPLERITTGLNLMLRDVATVSKGVMPGEYDRTSMQRYLSVTANVEGEDLGRAAAQIDAALKRVGEAPRGVRVITRGQIAPMRTMFASLAIGLAFSVITVFVLLTAYFQSWRLALVSLGAVPGVLSGVALMLLLTRTTLNIESFMGAIMCIGISVSNSVMLVSFTARDWQQGRPVQEAAAQGATERLRPILMTACAMTVGMVPMALALEAGSQLEAPLGRAVIGGLIVSTLSTLLMLPAIFSIVMGNQTYESPSLHPDDIDDTPADRGAAHDKEGDGDEPQTSES
jgi:multidrug efflux pump subunit AcrB